MRNSKFIQISFGILIVAVISFFYILNGKSVTIDAIAAPDDKYKALDTFSQALGIVENAYVEPLEDKEIIYGAIKGMLEELDPHSTFYNPKEYQSFQIGTKGSFGGLGITISMRNNEMTVIAPIEDTPAYRAGIKSGDVIVMIENESTEGMSLDEAVSKMRGEPGTKIKITIVRKNEPLPIDYTIKRDVIKIKSVKSDMIDNSIGYIRLTQFQENSTDELTKALQNLDKKGAKGIIIDLRNNGGGLLTEAIGIASLFLPVDKSVVYTKDRSGKEHHYKTKRITYRDNKRPIVVIVNGYSASASEILAGAVQDYGRAIVLGETTFGKASVQSIIEMADGSAMKLTTARYYTPKGRSIQGVGIVPDIEVGLGKIEYDDNVHVLKERDLSGHLVGENEKKETSTKEVDKKAAPISVEEEGKALNQILPDKTDLQYSTAIQVLKGMMTYGKTTN